ncbi:MAG: hypothetical protein ACREBD_06280 [Blastocatellia bacterium]
MTTITDLFRQARTLCATVLVVSAASVCAQAQFSSGSTGADGDFNPTASQTIIVPDSGVFNFKTVNIPAGVTITFLRNAKNTPLVILASGDVTIAGTISVAGRSGNNGGFGGPGGFNGGAGASGFDFFNGQPGAGPGGGGGGVPNTNTAQNGSGGGGGGHASAGASATSGAFVASGGQRYGTATMQPLIGGSGGGGGSARNANSGGIGGGGGGAILIASSTKITIMGNGTISADGGGSGSGISTFGGDGAGGAIRLIANEVVQTGFLLARGGASGGAAGGVGYIRLEALNLTVSGSVQPLPVTSLPGPVTASGLPALRITKVAGVDAPANPSGSLSAAPDVVIPASQSNPVTVEFATTNIPVGTTIQVTVTPASGARTTTTSSGITGADAAGAATASVTLSNGLSVINATATFALPQNVSLIIDGERVKRVEVGATWGGPSEVTYITESGKRIKRRSE